MKIWAKTDGEVREDKYLVVRRDGTVPEWGHMVLALTDAGTPKALRAYADECQRFGLQPDFVASVRGLARDSESISEEAKIQAAFDGSKGSDPDAGPHRKDLPEVIDMMRHNSDVAGLVSELTTLRGLADRMAEALQSVKMIRGSDVEDDWQECPSCRAWVDHYGHKADCKIALALAAYQSFKAGEKP